MTNDKGCVLLALNGPDPKVWQNLLAKDRKVVLEASGPADPDVDYAVVWKHRHGMLAGLPNLKVIFSMGAGVDHILTDPDLPDVPIVRVVAKNLTQHMVDYVVWRVTDHHRQGMFYRAEQARKNWREAAQPPSPDISVGILGLGELGRAAAKALGAIGYQVKGWTRSPRTVEGVETFSGEAGRTPFLNSTDILVVLLPHTPATEGIVDYDLLSKLRRDNGLGGACLINAGRGKLQKETDILRALDDGTLKEASLDVFEAEPLAVSSPLWSHPRVFVTPHAAATSDANHLAPLMLEQMARLERGESLQHVVDRAAGY
ncbi:2-hydroxyacid dehydrogenase [Aliihoeflea sp. PC F10.4]